VGEWSGNHNWQRFAKEVDAGMHTFTWAYIKDYGIDQYLDASWVDYISFPPTDAWSSIDKNENPIINQIRLYPNPANTNTTVEFNLLQSQSISTQLYNQLGQKVGAEINHGQHYAGLQSFSLNIDGLSQGIYFVEIRIGKQQYFQKLIIE
jgi:hypothetical protein